MAYGSEELIVGYALTEKKKKSFIKPSLVELARCVSCYWGVTCLASLE